MSRGNWAEGHSSGWLGLRPDEAEQHLAEHQSAVHRLHPDLKAAYDAWQRSGHQGSIYDFLPGNYRSLLK
jgi:hypothetical protein